MKAILKIALTAALLVYSSQSCLADRCITQGDTLNQIHSLHSDSIDPYAHLMGEVQDSNSVVNAYNLNLKPVVVNDLTKLQFRTYDSRSPAAGYTSPYLWEVGQGPGYRQNSFWGQPGRIPGPAFLPTRR